MYSMRLHQCWIRTYSVCEGDTSYGIVAECMTSTIVMIVECDYECSGEQLSDSVVLPEPYGIFITKKETRMEMTLLSSHADEDTLPTDILVPDFSSSIWESK